MDLQEKIDDRQAVVSVIGLGHVGLPLAVAFAEVGFRVVGIDADATRVESISRRESYIADVSSDALGRLVSDSSSVGNEGLAATDGRVATGLSVTTGYDALERADVVIVCVPTALSKTRDPDLSHIVSASDEIARRLRRGMLVVLESTTYPGTTEEVILPRLQRANGQELTAGEDFFLAYSPERIDPGRADWTVRTTPRVVGGVSPRCTEMATSLYASIVEEVVPVSSSQVAEMVKLLENTFRATNIALVNEIGIMCDRLGIDVWEVIEAAKTKPFGFMAFHPGPGLGGHCIPVDPQYLAWKLKTLNYDARFIRLAEEINLSMPLYWVNRTQDDLNAEAKPVRGSRILVLGVTYKRDTGDTRESPALDIIDQLLNKGAFVSYHDPYVPSLATDNYHLASISESDLDQGLADADCVVIVTDHSTYDWERVRERAALIVDTRNALGRQVTPVQASPGGVSGGPPTAGLHRRSPCV